MICKICSAGIINIAEICGYIYPEKFKINYCENCETVSADIKENYDFEKLYDRIYSSNNVTGGYKRYENYASIISRKNDPLKYLADAEPQYRALKIALSQISKKAKILEIGSGFGYTTLALRLSGYENAIGCDLSSEAVKKSRENFGEFYFDTKELQNQKFDFIFATEVIEHVVNPIEFLKENLERLNSNGRILVTTPRSITPIKNQTKNNVWISDPPPVHLWCFSEKSLLKISDKLNDVDVEILKIPLIKSVLNLKAISYEEKHVLLSDEAEIKKSNDYNTIFSKVKDAFKVIFHKSIILEDLRLIYVLLLKILRKGDRYSFLKKGETEIISAIYLKKF